MGDLVAAGRTCDMIYTIDMHKTFNRLLEMSEYAIKAIETREFVSKPDRLELVQELKIIVEKNTEV